MGFAEFYDRFQEHITLNKNVLVAAAGGIATSMGASEVADYLQNDPFVVMAIASATKILTDVGLFLPLHFRSNRHKYVTHDKVAWKRFYSDIFKIYMSAVPAIVAFYTVSGLSNTYMLKRGLRAAVSTATSYAIAFIPAQVMLTYAADALGAVRRTPYHSDVRGLER